MPRPDPATYPAYFDNYIKLVREEDIREAISNHTTSAVAFFQSLPADKTNYKYAEDKWTIKEVLQHVIDTERVFAYRALVFSRKDINPLPSFDENSYAANSGANRRKWEDLIAEFTAVRKSTSFLFDSFSEDQLDLTGRAGNYQMGVKALGYTIAGHVTHHIQVIKERYLQ